MFSLGMIYICFHRKKGVSVPSLLHKSISLLRLPALHIHYSYTTRLALSLFICLVCMQGQISEQGDLTGGLPVTSELELNVFFQAIRHEVSLVLQWEMLYF